jgi:hypothetical protein
MMVGAPMWAHADNAIAKLLATVSFRPGVQRDIPPHCYGSVEYLYVQVF